MNKVYKVIWSKARNCYVVASELAKSHTKAPKSGVISHALVLGVLAWVLSFRAVMPVYALDAGYHNEFWGSAPIRYTATGLKIQVGGDVDNPYNDPPIYETLIPSGHYYFYNVNNDDFSQGNHGQVYYVDLGTSFGGTSFTAGNGINISNNIISAKATNGIVVNGNGIGVKAGTGITVNSNGVSITPGSVASGNVNAITGGTAYTELRPANGTFVKSNQTTATNLTALDTASKNAIKGLSTNGSVLTYTKGDGTTGTISTFAKYVGINSSNGTNQTGEGASGEDAIAIGKNAKATKKGSIAIGLDSYADEENVISLGHNKSEFDDELNQYVDSVTDNPVGSTALFTNDLNRRITNVADGIYSNDVATYGQLMSIQGGVVAQNNTKLISGSTAFSELRPADGQFIRRANTTAQNLTALDTMGKNAVKSMTIDGNMLVYTRGDNTSISLDLPTTGSGTSPISRFTGEGMTTTVGSVTAFASNSTPTGYLLCDGRAVSRTKYANLFRKIGTTYGAGDGSTTFNLPNLVNRFVEGSNVSGQYINAGLPNITGGHGAWNYNVTEGAFYGRSDLSENIKSGGWTSTGVGFDASRSNPIYGRSDTVQPESLMMQYYIKTDDEFNGSRYMGVNTVSGYYNEFGEGATGTDATAIGRNASATGTASVALGRDTVASGNGVVSVGHLATDINPATNTAYGSELNRKITNVADGTLAHDVATYGQMNIADTALSNRIGVQAEDGNYIKKSATNSVTTNIALLDSKIGKENALNGNYTSANRTITANIKALDAKIGTPNSVAGWYTIADNTVNANIKLLDSQLKATEESIGNVNAGMNYISSDATVAQNLMNLDGSLKNVYEDVAEETVNRSNADIVLGNRIGLLTSDGNYIKKSDTNSVFQNLAVLDNQLKATENSSVKNLTLNNNTITFIKGDGSTGSISMHDTTYDSLTLEKALEGSDTSKNTISADVLNSFVLNRVNVEATNRMDADNALSDRIGTIASNGNYIKNSDINSLSTNLILLDNELKNTNTNIEGFARDITRNKESIRSLNTSVSSALGSVSSTSSLVTTLDNTKADASLNNLTSTGKQVIANAAINAVQEYIASQQNNYVPPVSPMMYSANPNALTVTNAGNGSLHVGEGSNVIGSQSIAIGVGNQVNANNSGAFGDPSIINADESYVLGNDDTINTGAIGSFVVGNDSVSSAKGGLTFGSNNTLEDTATDGVALGNNVTVSGVNSVALGSGSVANDANVVSVGNDSLKRKITNVLNGNISQDSSDAITGSQLFATNERVKTNEETIAQKANKDASNIDTVAWADRLGTGKIQESDSNLVTGGTVYNALSAVRQNDFVQATDEAIFIGPNQTDSMISVFNKNGEGRIVTGVVTNPEDASSAANVGYVNAVGQSIIGAVNDSITQMDTKINKVGANAAAMASLTPSSFEGDEKWSLSAGVGNYRGETAGAVGAFYRPVENVLMNVRGSFGNNENMVGAAVSVSLSKGDVPGVTKRQLANEVISLRQDLKQTKEQDRNQIAQLNQHIVHQDERIAELENLVQNMAKQINAGK